MIHIMLPAYNQAAALPRVLDDIRQLEWPRREPYTVLVVDDGSIDTTVSVCRARWDSMPLEVSCHITNRGLGECVMTGLKHCLARCSPDDVVISMCVGSPHSPALMPSMVRRIRAGSDVVIASRYTPGGGEIGVPAATRLLNGLAITMLRVAFPIPGIRDYTCGYRAYSARILERAFSAFSDRLVEQKGCVCMTELLIKLKGLGAQISEAPLVVRYDRQNHGTSHAQSSVGSYLRLISTRRPRMQAKYGVADVGRVGGARSDEAEE